MLQNFTFPNSQASQPQAVAAAGTLEARIQATTGNQNFTFDRSKRYFTSITCNTEGVIFTIDGTDPSSTNGIVLEANRTVENIPVNPFDIRVIRLGANDAQLSLEVNEVAQSVLADKAFYYEGILFPAKQFVVNNTSNTLENRIATVVSGYTIPFVPGIRQYFLFQTSTANGSFVVTNDGTDASATNGRLVPVSEVVSVWGNANDIRLIRVGTANPTVNIQAVTFPV